MTALKKTPWYHNDKVFDNTKEVKEILHAVSMPEFFKALKEKVDGYYESN